MISINNLCVTISTVDCPNLKYEFDFSEFCNHHLVQSCVEPFRIKYEKVVSITYLSVLTTAFNHYDPYLKINQDSGSISYSEAERSNYLDCLQSLYKPDGSVYSDNYIRFLLSAPGLL